MAKREEGRLEAKRKIRKEGSMQGEKRERQENNCRRARPREMGALEAPGVSGIIKGMRALPSMEVQGERGQVDMAVWEHPHFKKQHRTPKLHSLNKL